VAALGGTAGFIGKVGDDEFGEMFAHDLRTMGVELDLAISDDASRWRRDVATFSSPTTLNARWRPTWVLRTSWP
jgi:hypothetical protein